MEAMKAIEATFHRHSLAVVSLLGHICQKLVTSIIVTIARAKVLYLASSYNTTSISIHFFQNLAMRGKYTQAKLDILSALILAETSIALGPTTYQRKLVTELALCFASQARTFK